MPVEEGLDDVAAVTPPLNVKVSGACSIFAGVLSLVLALQAGAVLEVRGAFQLAVVLFAVCGLGGVVSGFRLTRLLGGSALLTTGFASLTLLSALGWFVVALMNGVLILLALPIVPIAGAAAITSFANRELVARADVARSRLRAQGLDLGL
jgi:hypothetical protein